MADRSYLSLTQMCVMPEAMDPQRFPVLQDGSWHPCVATLLESMSDPSRCHHCCPSSARGISCLQDVSQTFHGACQRPCRDKAFQGNPGKNSWPSRCWSYRPYHKCYRVVALPNPVRFPQHNTAARQQERTTKKQKSVECTNRIII